MAIQNNEQWLALVDAFQSAALGELTWDAALQGLADATGSRGSQLIGRKSDLTVLFNVMTGTEPAVQRLAIDLQALNPRPPVLERAPVLKVVADWDVISPEDAKRNRFYQEMLRPWDAPYFCATVLERREDAFVTLGLMRSHADGYVTPEQRHTFATLATHVRAAIRMQMALEGNSAAVLTASLETLSIPAFICDRAGRVVMMTAAAESLVVGGRGLELSSGRLYAARAADNRALDDAIAAALPTLRTVGPPITRSVVVHGRGAATAPIVLDVFALPSRPGALSLGPMMPRVMIVACGQRRADGRLAAILGATYRLTAAEVDIAQRLAAGESAQGISVLRGVSVGTVRGQIKTVLSKLGVRRQAELAARLNQL